MARKLSVAWPALKGAAIKLYDHLGIAMGLSLLWLIIGVGPLLFAFPLLLDSWLLGGISLVLLASLFFFPSTCAIWEACQKMMTREGATVGSFFHFFGKHFKKAFLFGLADGFLFLVLAADLFVAFWSGNRFFQFMAGVWIWFGVFLLLMQLYLLPQLITGQGIIAAFKKAALLVLDNLGTTLLLLIESVAIVLLALLVPPLLVLFFPVMMGFFQMKTYQLIMSKYDDEEDDDAQVAGA